MKKILEKKLDKENTRQRKYQIKKILDRENTR